MPAKAAVIVLFSLIASRVQGFGVVAPSVSRASSITAVKSRYVTKVQAWSDSYNDYGEFGDSDVRSTPFSLSRRQAVTLPLLLAALASSANAETVGTSPDKPVCILGAGGRVGLLCAQELAQKGVYVRALTRSGRDLSLDKKYVSYAAADVTKLDSLEAALKGASACVFAASASSKGGDPAHVDYLGVVNTAKACLDNNVSKLVVLSAGTVTRPNSLGFKATNFFVKYIYGDNIMGYKLAGENAVRDLYAGNANCKYTIIRPGGLSDKQPLGPDKVHISQGDVYSSEISRIDVASVTVAAVLADIDNATFELNTVEGLGKAEKGLPDLGPNLIHTGGLKYSDLLVGLYSDNEMKKQYPELFNEFGGGKIEPLEKLRKA